VTAKLKAILYTDPCCPWGYSANPALRLLEWRYGDQIDFGLVMIGLTERAEEYLERGFTPVRAALSALYFRRYGMPFRAAPKTRITATGRACRAVVATRLLYPGREWAVLRALQFAQFTSPLLLDEDHDLAQALAEVPGIDAQTVVSALDSVEVARAYASDRERSRSAVATPSELQEKTATTAAGEVRYTAPSVVFERDGLALEAGGFQPPEAYDVLVANLDPTLARRPTASDAAQALEPFPEGLTTQEVAQLIAANNEQPDPLRAEQQLIELVGEGRVERRQLGDGALWRLTGPVAGDH